ncbi:PspC domain-containing protein [Alkalibaculum sp. M08DMB]|uniref:PspC domain-containing protein n=1 Tax=Alkalibaculum sporogenes TaxID=2655001 RepID=A0A6A7K7I6_9FIRM|nr:PspC domain-containing protein [Alkalibaculum sporogenes]MPW25380.1 PspC domain-containing protein [Alkalibaculum sporogenes]
MKKLYKNRAKAKISGVCQGIAEYFDIDPSLVRIVWAVVSIPSFGIGFFLYIICAIILPDKSELEFNDYSVSDE